MEVIESKSGPFKGPLFYFKGYQALRKTSDINNN